MKKILVVAAHPDDDVLGCGGYMAKYSSVCEIRVIFIAEGSSCRYTEGQFQAAPLLLELTARKSAAERALDILGVGERVFFDLPCGRLDREPIININKIIESEILRFSPDAIFSHSASDVNNDHRIVARAVQMATRPGTKCGVSELYSFEIPSSSEWNFQEPFAPNYFEALEHDHIRLKWKALACFDSETQEYPHPRSEQGLESYSRYRGMQAGVNFAEAYVLNRMVAK